MTLKIEGCKALASCKGIEAVTYFLVPILVFLNLKFPFLLPFFDVGLLLHSLKGESL